MNIKSTETEKATRLSWKTSIGLCIAIAATLSIAPLVVGSVLTPASAAVHCYVSHYTGRVKCVRSGIATNTGSTNAIQHQMYINMLKDQLRRNAMNAQFGTGLAGGLSPGGFGGGFSMGCWTC